MKETMDFTGTLEKKHGWPRRAPGFQSKHPRNFISHYISNLITWWNVTPAGVLGCWDRAEACGKTRWAHSMVSLCLCYRWRIRWTSALHPGRLASLRRKPRPPFINASSWAAAMSCQAALRLSTLYSMHMQGPGEAARASITSLSGLKIRPTHLPKHPTQKQAPPFTPQAWGSEIRKALPPWYEPWERCLPSTLAALPLKLIKCNYTYIMGHYAFNRMTAIVNHFLPLMASHQIVFCKAELYLTHSTGL